MRIDAHQHFWLFDPIRDSWITEDMLAIQRDFLPNDLAPLLKANSIDGVVAVQADQSPEETQFLVELSGAYAMIKGVVGWVDLRSNDIGALLDGYADVPVIKGFRHIIEGEDDPNFLMQLAFQKGIRELTKRNYTYDLLISAIHYESTLRCTIENPNQKFVLDHIAKPNIQEGEYERWADFIKKLAQRPNVYCKISGLVTEAKWGGWRQEDFSRYFIHAVRCFGTDRIMFGSDWPVCLLSATYDQWIEIVKNELLDFSEDDLEKFWGKNASRFYNLK